MNYLTSLTVNKIKAIKLIIMISVLMLSVSCVNTTLPVSTSSQTDADEEGESITGSNETIAGSDEDAKASVDEAEFLDTVYNKEEFYNIDAKVDISDFDIPFDKFLSDDLTINMDIDADKPKILIYHTHSSEMYCDSSGELDGVVGIGRKLKTILEEQYQIPVVHNTSRFDCVDSEIQIVGSYTRAKAELEAFLKENPSIEIAIDVHRDGVPDDVKLITTINESDVAQIMFYNNIGENYPIGSDKELVETSEEILYDNLSLSFNMQLAANELYPGFARKIYLGAFGQNLMSSKSLHVEVGAQTNTQLEAENSAIILAEILANVIKTE